MNQEPISSELATIEDLFNYHIERQIQIFQHTSNQSQSGQAIHPFGKLREFGRRAEGWSDYIEAGGYMITDEGKIKSPQEINLNDPDNPLRDRYPNVNDAGYLNYQIYQIEKTSDSGSELFAIFNGALRGTVICRIPSTSATIWIALHSGELRSKSLSLFNNFIPVQDILYKGDKPRVYINENTDMSTVLSFFTGHPFSTLFFLISDIAKPEFKYDPGELIAFVFNRSREPDFQGYKSNNMADKLVQLIKDIYYLKMQITTSIDELNLRHHDTGNFSDWLIKYIKKDNLNIHLSQGGNINNLPQSFIEFTPWNLLNTPGEYLAVPFLIDFEDIDFVNKDYGDEVLPSYRKVRAKEKAISFEKDLEVFRNDLNDPESKLSTTLRKLTRTVSFDKSKKLSAIRALEECINSTTGKYKRTKINATLSEIKDI